MGTFHSSLGQIEVTYQYFYDDTGQLVKVVDSTGVVIEYVYDEVGNMVEIRRATFTITTFSPEQGVVGTEVTVQGLGFGATPSDNLVQLNGITATVTFASSTMVKFIVPPSATTGRISLTTQGQTTLSNRSFVVIRQPVITSIQPTIALAGRLVNDFQITGENLSNSTFFFTPISSTVPITIESPIINSEGTLATAVVVVDANATGDYWLTATNPAGSSVSSAANTLHILAPAADTDHDDLSNEDELALGTDPLNPDSDGDGYWDGLEVGVPSDPLDLTRDPYNASNLPGEAVSPVYSIVNLADPSAPNLPGEAVSPVVSIINTSDPISTTLPGEVDSPVYSIENTSSER